MMFSEDDQTPTWLSFFSSDFGSSHDPAVPCPSPPSYGYATDCRSNGPFSTVEHFNYLFSVTGSLANNRDVNKATGVKAKARDMRGHDHRPKASANNAKVNFQLNAIVNPFFKL